MAPLPTANTALVTASMIAGSTELTAPAGAAAGAEVVGAEAVEAAPAATPFAAATLAFFSAFLCVFSSLDFAVHNNELCFEDLQWAHPLKALNPHSVGG